jgi:hypothetical protein
MPGCSRRTPLASMVSFTNPTIRRLAAKPIMSRRKLALKPLIRLAAQPGRSRNAILSSVIVVSPRSGCVPTVEDYRTTPQRRLRQPIYRSLCRATYPQLLHHFRLHDPGTAQARQSEPQRAELPAPTLEAVPWSPSVSLFYRASDQPIHLVAQRSELNYKFSLTNWRLEMLECVIPCRRYLLGRGYNANF